MPLTDAAIRSAKPQNKTAKMFDGGGLYLEVDPNGGKWWRLKYRVPAAKMKMKQRHIVPLSRQALGILEELKYIIRMCTADWE